MPRFSKSVRVPYSKLQAFNLVSDIASYPDFIKWITAMRVSEVRTDEAGIRHSRGDAVVGFKGFVERFAMLAAANHDIAVDRIMSAFLVEAQNRYGQAPIASAPE